MSEKNLINGCFLLKTTKFALGFALSNSNKTPNSWWKSFSRKMWDLFNKSKFEPDSLNILSCDKTGCTTIRYCSEVVVTKRTRTFVQSHSVCNHVIWSVLTFRRMKYLLDGPEDEAYEKMLRIYEIFKKMSYVSI